MEILKFDFHVTTGLFSIAKTCNFTMFSDQPHMHMDMTATEYMKDHTFELWRKISRHK